MSGTCHGCGGEREREREWEGERGGKEGGREREEKRERDRVSTCRHNVVWMWIVRNTLMNTAHSTEHNSKCLKGKTIHSIGHTIAM